MQVRTDMLLQLADFLKQPTPSAHFNYTCWVGYDWAGKPDLSCGTSACALGWSTVLFPNILHLERIHSSVARVIHVDLDPTIVRHHSHYYTSIQSAMLAFGLQEWQAEYLSTPDEEPTEELYDQLDKAPREGASAHQVAQHIRRFVKWVQAHQ